MITALVDGGASVELEQIHAAGVFEGVLEGAELPSTNTSSRSTTARAGRFTIEDPYRFLADAGGARPVPRSARAGTSRSTSTFGSHRDEHEKRSWDAHSPYGPRRPAAVSVVGDFNSWDGRLDADALGAGHERVSGAVPPRRSVRRRADTSTRSSPPPTSSCLKADPYAQETELPPSRRASVVFRSAPSVERARDAVALDGAPGRPGPLQGPMSIHEVHLGSWRLDTPRRLNRPLTYRELADELRPTSKEHGLHARRASAVMAPRSRAPGVTR